MTSMVTAKVVLPDGTIRRVGVPRDVSVAGLRKLARDMLPAPADVPADDDVGVAYKDEEGDDIAVVTDKEVRDYFDAAEKANKTPKFFVHVRRDGGNANANANANAAPQAEAEADAEQAPKQPEQQPEDALTQLARALSNPSTVHAVQAHVASSPVLTETVASVSRAFVEGGGMRAMAAAAEAVPALRTVAVDASQVDPALANAVKALMRDVDGDGDAMGGDAFAFPFPFSAAAAAWMPFLGAAFHHPQGHPHAHAHPHPHAHAHAHAQQQAHAPPPRVPGVHPFVVCDGCDTASARAAASRQAGTVSPRGWIAGTRYASTSVRNFDLCETCHASGAFAASHGPFVAMEPKAPAWAGPHHRHGHGPGGCGRRWHHGHHGHHGHGPCHGAFGEGWAAQCQTPPAAAASTSSTQRGCRGSGRVGVVNAMNEVIGRCAEAVAAAAHEAEQDDVAQIARAISESLKTHAEEEAKPPKAVPVAKDVAKAASVATNVEGVRKVVAEQAPASASATTTTSSTSDEEWVVEDVKPGATTATTTATVTTTTTADPMDKWRDALQRLHAIGFTDAAEYIPLLEEENGDLERVINRIVRRNA